MILQNQQLRPHPGSKELIQSLRYQEADEIIYPNASDIDTVAEFLSIDPSYLSIQVRLLIPSYTKEEIIQAKNDIKLLRNILVKLRNSLSGFENNYKYHQSRNGIIKLPNDLKIVDNGNVMCVKNSTISYKVNFGIVDPDIGLCIQDNIHYIHKNRSDTLFHFGLFLDGNNYPLCYCSFSLCDRKYQANAISNVIGEKVELDEIFVLTRSYGFNPLPHNMMSKLFEKSISYIKVIYRKEKKYPKFVITALNPLLGFSGGIFLGSSFVAFATSPMEYWYDSNGLYLNRRATTINVKSQSSKTPPIVWLVRPITKRARLSLEKISNYYKIEKEEYQQG